MLKKCMLKSGDFQNVLITINPCCIWPHVLTPYTLSLLRSKPLYYQIDLTQLKSHYIMQYNIPTPHSATITTLTYTSDCHVLTPYTLRLI